ncbi:elongation factor P hydroxylase [Thalassotalea mangrovi]|uniref:Elongation factor P hydroxylase n=1 Tax=Thalassotalea mangrovi TaxID=2572245 RepID=A0A4U1B5J3_9GAMM|nr:elongation factor P hydroxylase [Thalassotalea mangrovi]TKB45081.1 elongation factor P hydroxylase [Thalassotalea mangrovi]
MKHDIDDLIAIFNHQFSESENTLLVRGEDEPVYLPANNQYPYHRIKFAHGFYASALHEIAHWCIAGKERRLLEDFGYWYAPDGRNAQQQAEFEQVEIKPQAIEWAFCVAAGFKFNVSADNLSGIDVDRAAFKAKVYHQVGEYLRCGFPKRAQQFITALQQFYDRDNKLQINQFVLKDCTAQAEGNRDQNPDRPVADAPTSPLETACYV